jgi:hypothetical protein
MEDSKLEIGMRSSVLMPNCVRKVRCQLIATRGGE